MEWVLALGIVAAVYAFTHQAPPPQGSTLTPAPPVPTTDAIGSGLTLSGGYQVTPDATQLAGPYAISPVGVPSILPPTTLPPPPPYVSGGIAGGVGTGGNPLGGVVRPGVSAGTATTSLLVTAAVGPGPIRKIGGTIVAPAGNGDGTAPIHWSGIRVIS